MKNPIFDLEIGGRLIHEFDLYMSKYGRWFIDNSSPFLFFFLIMFLP